MYLCVDIVSRKHRNVGRLNVKKYEFALVGFNAVLRECFKADELLNTVLCLFFN